MNDDSSTGQVCAGTWVTLRYRLFDSTGEPVEENEREITYLHGGFGDVFAAIETALDGADVGERRSIYLEPDKTFGEYDADRVRLAARADLPDEIEVGMSLEGSPDEPGDDTIYTVTDIAVDTVVLDGNHPLAGMALRFDLEVKAVREASAEELARERLLHGDATQ